MPEAGNFDPALNLENLVKYQVGLENKSSYFWLSSNRKSASWQALERFRLKHELSAKSVGSLDIVASNVLSNAFQVPFGLRG